MKMREKFMFNLQTNGKEEKKPQKTHECKILNIGLCVYKYFEA